MFLPMEQKWWLNSATIRGILVAVLPTIAILLKAFGVDFGSDEQTAIINGVVGVIGMAGAIYAVIGRFKATKTLGGRNK